MLSLKGSFFTFALMGRFTSIPQTRFANETTTQESITVTQSNDRSLAQIHGKAEAMLVSGFRANFAWMLTCSAHLLRMTAFGLALLAGFENRKKNGCESEINIPRSWTELNQQQSRIVLAELDHTFL